MHCLPHTWIAQIMLHVCGLPNGIICPLHKIECSATRTLAGTETCDHTTRFPCRLPPAPHVLTPSAETVKNILQAALKYGPVYRDLPKGIYDRQRLEYTAQQIGHVEFKPLLCICKLI